MARIDYGASGTGGGAAVWSVVNGALTAWYSAQRLKAEMDSLIGAVPDYTKLETPFGLPSGTGNVFYTAFVNLVANLGTASAALKDMDRLA